MSDSNKGCWTCFFRFIFTLGFASLFMWLSLRTKKPRCYLQYFYLPSLNRSINSQHNTTLYFILRLENPNKDKGIYYDDLNVTFFDAPNRSHVIGNSVITRFYQGHEKKATKKGSVSKTNETAVFRAVQGNGSAVFGVDLATAVRFKIMAWKTKRETIKVGADVEVNDQGSKVNKKNIRLKSGAAAATTKMGDIMVLAALLNFLAFIFLNFC